MFKYKSSPIVIVVLLVLSSIFFAIYYKISKIEIEKDNKLLTNDIVFSGIITDLKVSKNHAFGILQLKIIKTNNYSFKPYLEGELYPYAIKDSVAEIYNYIPLSIKKGYKVQINSNKKTITFYDGDKIKYQWEIYIVSEERDIDFVKKNTIFDDVGNVSD
ncbi:hypothetical protein [Flavobacterium chungangensis]|uniref:Uncharacterized protein n=1 Tax=Flavobacterium chungangensis TaxID=2708132 RepID=A0ABV8ZC30_9FLAO